LHLPLHLSCLIIFTCRVVDVSLGTVRIIYLTRGQSKLAAAIGFVEMIIYMIALSTVMGNLDHPVNVVFYALGFAVGSYVGSKIEEMIAVGYVNVQVITKERCKRHGRGAAAGRLWGHRRGLQRHGGAPPHSLRHAQRGATSPPFSKRSGNWTRMPLSPSRTPAK